MREVTVGRRETVSGYSTDVADMLAQYCPKAGVETAGSQLRDCQYPSASVRTEAKSSLYVTF